MDVQRKHFEDTVQVIVDYTIGSGLLGVGDLLNPFSMSGWLSVFLHQRGCQQSKNFGGLHDFITTNCETNTNLIYVSL